MRHFEKYAVQPWQLAQRQSLPLDAKIALSKLRIRAFYEQANRMTYVAWSGGLCSRVLLDLVRSEFPDTPAVFCDTGLEYPEVRACALAQENVITLRPRMTFGHVIQRYGYPCVSRRTAQYIKEARAAKGQTATYTLRMTGINSRGGTTTMGMIPQKYQYLVRAPFAIGDGCCNVMKKQPSRRYQKETGRWPFLGTRTEEGKQREMSYLMHGCNVSKGKLPRSTPLAFWLTSDIWEYVRSRNLDYAKVYDMGYARTGCMFCMFGVHLEQSPNRFQRMAITHPAQWRYCMDKLGLARVLNYMHIKYKPEPGLFDGEIK